MGLPLILPTLAGAGLWQLGRSAVRIARWAGLGRERILTPLPLRRLAEVTPR